MVFIWAMLLLALTLLVTFLLDIKESEFNFPIGIFITLCIVNIVVFVTVLINVVCNNKFLGMENYQENHDSLLKERYMLLFLFGGCHFLHSVINICIHKDHKWSWIAYISTIVYIFSLLLHYKSFRFLRNDFIKCTALLWPKYIKCLLPFASIINFLIPLSHYTNGMHCDSNSSAQIASVEYASDKVEMEKTNLILSPYIIGFSVLVLDFEFPRVNVQNHSMDYSSNQSRSLMQSICYHVLLFVFFIVLSFVITEQLTNYSVSDFKMCITIQVAIKCAILCAFFVFVMCLLCKTEEKSKNSGAKKSKWLSFVWIGQLIISSILSFTHEIILLISKLFLEESGKENEILYILNDILNILVVIFQVAFFIIPRKKKVLICKYYFFSKVLCFLLGVFNIIIMILESTGRDWLTLFVHCRRSEIIASQQNFIHISLYFKLYFYCQCGYEFLKIYLTSNLRLPVQES